MIDPTTIHDLPIQRPQRADARRNYEKLVAAAREAFAEDGTSATLEDIARRAGVGIGTLYRHFPTRQHLLEAVYVDEVEAISRSAEDLADLPPWEALASGCTSSSATPRRSARSPTSCSPRSTATPRSSRPAEPHYRGRRPLLERAQAAGVVRPDANFKDVVRLVGGIAAIPGDEPDEVERLLDIVLDGLRYQPGG